MASTIPDDICTEAASEANAPPFSITVAEAASQTFKKGWPVFINGSGFIADVASDTPSTIFGIAAEDAHNDTTAGTHSISVNVANATNIFAANMKQVSLADHVLVQADLGRPMAIQRDTSNNRLFLNASTFQGANVRVFTLRTAQASAVGDTNARVLFVFLGNWAQSQGTS